MPLVRHEQSWAFGPQDQATTSPYSNTWHVWWALSAWWFTWQTDFCWVVVLIKVDISWEIFTQRAGTGQNSPAPPLISILGTHYVFKSLVLESCCSPNTDENCGCLIKPRKSYRWRNSHSVRWPCPVAVSWWGSCSSQCPFLVISAQ